jgi:hypothetical protein
VQLEAIGEAGIPTLRDALDSKDSEIRFYAAEALAYLDVPDAVEVLDAAIRREPAFRWRALTALGAMDDVAAHEALIGLLHVASAESRYGAFRVLRRRTPDDPMIDGEVVNDSFSMHQVSTTGPPLIHVSRIERPEIVFFGSDHEFAEPVVLFAGNEIVVRSNQTDGVSVSRLSAGGEDASVDCSRRVTDVVRAIAQLEGNYADVVHALTEARRNGCLKSRLEFSAIPTTGRSYRRGTTEEDLPGEDQLPPESPGAEPPDLRPGPIDLATNDRTPDDLSNDQPSQRLTAGLPSENPVRADSDPPRSVAASPASELSVESSTRLLHDLPAAAGAAAAAPRAAPRLVPMATTTGTATLIPNMPAAVTTRTSMIPPVTNPRISSSVSAPAPGVDPSSPSMLADKVASELRRAPRPAAPSAPTRLGAARKSKGVVAPLPPEMGPVLEFSDLIDPQTLPD